MRLNKENTIGLIVDMQERLLPHIEANDEVLNKCIILVNGLRILNTPIIVTQQYTKGLGNTVQPINEAMGTFSFIEKITFSCYREESFLKIFNNLPGKNVLIAGIESHICVMQTALDLLYNSYTPVIIADAVGSRKNYDKKIALDRMRDAGCIITTTESILFELCQQAGSVEFKEISKLIK